MPTIGQKTTKIKKSICGDFVTEDGGFVGILVKVAKGQYVICGVDNMLKIVWTSALFTAKEFKKHSICRTNFLPRFNRTEKFQSYSPLLGLKKWHYR
jgi:hypothetical protein